MLAPGTRLGPYELLSVVGAGGMGEVYKARDTRLDRIVAVKVLPPDFAAAPDVRERFEREARIIASLSHPHICTLHDVGREADIHFLVMEHLDGETLEQRLRRGAVPVDRALPLAIQIADALAAAHRAGVTHRDLKPGNIMLTRTGAKLLDFGLAKVAAPAVTEGLSMLPTTPPGLTQQGTILGTLQYMAPEQLEGREADVRTDVFAFGALLYEMLTGRRAFDASTPATLAAAILTQTPPDPGPGVPSQMSRLVRKCLEKDPDARWQNALDLKTELEWIGHAVDAPSPRAGRRPPYAAVAAALLTGALLATGVMWWALSTAPRPSEPMRRLSVVLPPTLSLTRGEAPVLSPDGSMLAFSASDESGQTRLWIRRLDDIQPRALPGTEGVVFPFWSPDGRQLAFFAGGYLKRIDVSAGAPVIICRVPITRGGTWGAGDTIVFAGIGGPLQRVPAGGGDPVPVTRLDAGRGEFSHRLPSFLPDGRRFLFSILGDSADDRVLAVGSLDSEDVVRLGAIGASKALHVEPGFLVFMQGDTAMAQRFDVDRLALAGAAFPLASPVTRSIYAFAEGSFSVARDGTLAYWSASNASELVWLDRAGRTLSTVAPAQTYSGVSLAPDDRLIAFNLRKEDFATEDIWVVDPAGGAPTPLTQAGAVSNLSPVWLGDSKAMVYASTIAAGVTTFMRRDLARPQSEPVWTATQIAVPDDLSRDGRLVVFTDYTRGDIWVLPLADPVKAAPLLDSEFEEKEAALSPDGRWLAYTSNESGAPEVYVQSFPGLGAKYRVSSGGGTRATWRGDGRELYYFEPRGRRDAMVAVEVGMRSGSELVIGMPRRLFETATIRHTLLRNYAVTRDGQRFLVMVPSASDTETLSINLLLGWAQTGR